MVGYHSLLAFLFHRSRFPEILEPLSFPSCSLNLFLFSFVPRISFSLFLFLSKISLRVCRRVIRRFMADSVRGSDAVPLLPLIPVSRHFAGAEEEERKGGSCQLSPPSPPPCPLSSFGRTCFPIQPLPCPPLQLRRVSHPNLRVGIQGAK